MPNNETLTQLIEIYKQIFPPKLENEYELLTKLIHAFQVNMEKQKKLDKTIYHDEQKVLFENQRITKILKTDAPEIINQIKQLIDEINTLNNNLANNPYNIEIPNEMKDKITNISNLQKALHRLSLVKTTLTNDTLNARDIQNKIMRIVSLINDELIVITKLNINNADRLKNLHIDIRHQNKITGEQKDQMQKFLAIYFELRRLCFLNIKEYAEILVTKYKNREYPTTGQNEFAMINFYLIKATTFKNIENEFNNISELLSSFEIFYKIANKTANENDLKNLTKSSINFEISLNDFIDLINNYYNDLTLETIYALN